MTEKSIAKERENQAEPVLAGVPSEEDSKPRETRAPSQLQIDDSRALAAYANFCRVTGTPEELIIDFGLNDHPFGAQTHRIAVTQRIVANYYTAKRLLQVLHMTIQRHEAAFGVLETNVQKRARPGAAGRAQAPQEAS